MRPAEPVTAGPPDAARAPGGAVAAALADVATLGGFFALRTDAPDEGWHPVQHSYDRGFADLSTAVTDRYRTTDQRVGVSIAQLGHAARLWSPVLACTLLHGIVPDLDALRRQDTASALGLPAPAGWYADRLPDGELAVGAQVMDHLSRLEAGLAVRIAPRLLDGNAASALMGSAGVLLAARPETRVPLTRLVTRLLGTGRLVGTGSVTGPGLAFRRRSCCLYYRTPAGSKCGDCCLAR
ncbi:(2Fe-2S)-binding protein [Streptomyces sp. NPDC001822]|uniref:(2Fe-2S)-binding protein n=1 Tax=Streptomyces sp. NPDC001822 TaxID=3364614 RepID=UPI0036977D67